MMNRDVNLPVELPPNSETNKRSLHEVARSMAMEHAMKASSQSDAKRTDSSAEGSHNDEDSDHKDIAALETMSKRKRRRLLQANMTEEERRAERRAANRRSAFESRQRRKILIEDLQETVQKLSKENAAIRKEADALRQELEQCRRENRQLRLQQLNASATRLNSPAAGGGPNTSGLFSGGVGGGMNSPIPQLGFSAGGLSSQAAAAAGLLGSSTSGGGSGNGQSLSNTGTVSFGSLRTPAGGMHPALSGLNSHQLGLFGNQSLNATRAAAGMDQTPSIATAIGGGAGINTGALNPSVAATERERLLVTMQQQQKAAAGALLAEQAARAGLGGSGGFLGDRTSPL